MEILYSRKISIVGILLCMSGVLALSACSANTPKKMPSYSELLSQAEAAVYAGRIDDAVALFEDASKADPTMKQPWVRIAKLQFDRDYYAQAIEAAKEILQRDANDDVADSILAVSGFQIANESLKRLRDRGALSSEQTRNQMQELASTLIEIIGPDVLGQQPRRAAPAPRPRAAATRSTATTSANPPGAARSPVPASSISAQPAATRAATAPNTQSSGSPLSSILSGSSAPSVPQVPSAPAAPAVSAPAAPSLPSPPAASGNPFERIGGK